jgi:hypothetical protein
MWSAIIDTTMMPVVIVHLEIPTDVFSGGKFVYYTKALAGTSLWRLPEEGGPATKLLENLSDLRNLVIADEGIYFVPEQGAAPGSSIQFLNLATNQIGPVADFGKPLGAGGLALSPDGRWILCTHFDHGGAELRLVENFH